MIPVHFDTGADGFISSHLVEALLKQGKQVISVDQLSALRHNSVSVHDGTLQSPR